MLRLFIPITIFGFVASIVCGCTPSSKKNRSKLLQSDSMKVVRSTLLSPNDFESKLTSLANAQLIDVRTSGEVNKGFIKGAINIDYQGNSFTIEVEKLDKKKPTFVYCQSGGRSSESCLYMGNHGFTELYELKNGFSAWANEKKPIEFNKLDKK